MTPPGFSAVGEGVVDGAMGPCGIWVWDCSNGVGAISFVGTCDDRRFRDGDSVGYRAVNGFLAPGLIRCRYAGYRAVGSMRMMASILIVSMSDAQRRTVQLYGGSARRWGRDDNSAQLRDGRQYNDSQHGSALHGDLFPTEFVRLISRTPAYLVFRGSHYGTSSR